MSFILENWVLILVAFASGGMLVWPAVSRGGGSSVSPSQAVQLMNREKAVVIDVCDPAEYAAAHVSGARNVPAGALAGSKDLPSNKSLPVILVCASGARSGRAVGQLRKAGYEKVFSLAGGLGAWREAQLPVEKSGKG